MNGWIPIVISSIALSVTITSAWLTWFRRGKLRMTQPTVIFFGPDGGSRSSRRKHLKVFLRTLLYSTANRGQTIESLYVNLQREDLRQNFSIWVYGDKQLARGSGLFVPKEGIACNHHFLLPEDGTKFKLEAGEYILRLYAKQADRAAAKELMSVQLRITDDQALELLDADAGIYFDWEPSQQSYLSLIENRSPELLQQFLVDLHGQ
jgi:hypothetical protein